MTKTSMTAQRIGPNKYNLFANTYKFGELRWGAGRWEFTSHEEDIADYGRGALKRVLRSATTQEALAALRAAYEAWDQDMAAQAAAEIAAENAWLRAAETPTPRMMAEDDYEREREANDPWLQDLRNATDLEPIGY